MPTKTVFCAVLLHGLIAFSVTAQTLKPTRPESVGMSSQRLEVLSKTLDKYVADEKIAGGVAMVIRRGKTTFVHPFGNRDRESQSKMKPDTIFRIASQTKALTSVAAMMLFEDGKLVLSDPVSKYIPEFEKTTVAVPKEDGRYEIVPAKRRITIRDLLTHTAGTGYGLGVAKDRWEAAQISGWYFANRDEAIAETMRRIASLPMEAQPGEKWIYGYATDVLGVVVERASGVSLEDFFRTRIFEPLKMSDTHFYLPSEKRERLATVYSIVDGKLKRAPEPGLGVGQGSYVDGPRKSFSGGAGLLSTAHDYSRFLQMIANGGTLDGARILSRKTTELMTQNHLSGIEFRKGQGFGIGFSIVKDVGIYGQPSSEGEFGWGGAYHSVYWVDPKEQLIVVYLSQLIPTGNLDDYEKLRAIIHSAIID